MQTEEHKPLTRGEIWGRIVAGVLVLLLIGLAMGQCVRSELERRADADFQETAWSNLVNEAVHNLNAAPRTTGDGVCEVPSTAASGCRAQVLREVERLLVEIGDREPNDEERDRIQAVYLDFGGCFRMAAEEVAARSR